LDALVTNHGSTTFRSFEGEWIGADGDTDLTFFPKGEVHMFEYGVGLSSSRGAYTIEPSGRVTLQFPTFGNSWPAMLLQKDARSLLLVPVVDDPDVVFGNRGGVTTAPGPRGYWPFRPLAPTEQQVVLDRIEKWEHAAVP
jgi:hypothetical protein